MSGKTVPRLCHKYSTGLFSWTKSGAQLTPPGWAIFGPISVNLDERPCFVLIGATLSQSISWSQLASLILFDCFDGLLVNNLT